MQIPKVITFYENGIPESMYIQNTKDSTVFTQSDQKTIIVEPPLYFRYPVLCEIERPILS